MEEAGRGAWPGPSVRQSAARCGRGRGTERLRAQQSPPPSPGPGGTDRIGPAARSSREQSRYGAPSGSRGRCDGDPEPRRGFAPLPSLPPARGRGAAGGRRGTKVTARGRGQNTAPRRQRAGGVGGARGRAATGRAGGGGRLFFSSRRDCGGTRRLWGLGRAIGAAWAAPPQPARCPRTHAHTHTYRRSVSPLSRSGPSLPAPSRPRSLLFFFFLFFPAAAAALPPSLPPFSSPRPAPARSCGCCSPTPAAGSALPVRAERGGGGVWGEGAGRGRGRSPHKAAPPGEPSRTMEEGPPFPGPRRGVRVWRGHDPGRPFLASRRGRGGGPLLWQVSSPLTEMAAAGAGGAAPCGSGRGGGRERGRAARGGQGEPRGAAPGPLLYPGASGRRGPQRFVLNSRSGLGRSAPAECFTAA